MLQIDIEQPDGTLRSLQVPDDCVIGKGVQNEVRLDSWRVGKEHARLFATPSGVLLDDLGTFAGTSVNGGRVQGQHGPLRADDVIGIGPFKLKVAEAVGDLATASAAAGSPRAGVHTRDASNVRKATAGSTGKSDGDGDGDGAMNGASASTATPVAATTDLPATALDEARRLAEFEWRRRVHAKLLETMDLRRHDVHSMSDERLRRETETLVRQIVGELDSGIPAQIDRASLRQQVLDEAIGLGPLEELLADESITEIMVNRYDEIYVERAGRLHRHPLAFTGERAVMGVIERIVAPLGRRIDESSPMVDARLKDGSRVNAIIPPLALKGPCLTIRKFAKRKLDWQDLVAFGAIAPAMADFLQICVVARKNIVVSGGTGSGKTTLLNILSNDIPAGERVITVEDAAELQLHHEHLISLEARPANLEGKGAIPIRELVKNTLRMRPDRIVVGECRGAEALDMLQAMNTGHEGSLTTLHANSPRDALARLETMVLMAGMDLPLAAIREQVAGAVDVIVQQTRFACGTRVITSITELTGMESGKIQLQELFRFQNQGFVGEHGKVRGHFTGCDMVPTFYEELRATGSTLDMSAFAPVASPFAVAVDGVAA